MEVNFIDRPCAIVDRDRVTGENPRMYTGRMVGTDSEFRVSGDVLHRAGITFETFKGALIGVKVEELGLVPKSDDLPVIANVAFLMPLAETVDFL